MGSQPLDFGWICSFDNGADSYNLPASSSSSDSLSALNSPNPYEVYQRIKILEAREYYNLPPQNNAGDYERLVREHLSRARTIGDDFYKTAYDREYFELRVLERKGILQDRLTNLLLNEKNIDRIMELSPYTDIRTEAYHFLQNKLEPVNDLSHAFQRHLMDGSLNYFIQQMNQHDGQSDLYREFYRYFTDEEFRRANGLPLP